MTDPITLYVGLAVAVAIIGGIVWYLHTAAGKALETKLTSGLTSLEASLGGKFTSIETTLGLVHAAAIAPVSVTVVPAPPVAAPVAAPAAVAPHATMTVSLTPQQSSNLLLYGNIMGPSQGQAGSGSVGVAPVAAATTDPAATLPLNGGTWRPDITNGQSLSISVPLTAGSWVASFSEGLTQGFASAFLAGVGALVQEIPFTVGADGAYALTATAVPGNPNASQTRVGIALRKA